MEPDDDATELRETIDAVRALSEPGLPEEFYAAVRSSVMAEIERQPRPGAGWARAGLAAAAAVAIAASAVALWPERTVPAEKAAVPAVAPRAAEPRALPVTPPKVEGVRRRPRPASRKGAPRATARPRAGERAVAEPLRIEVQTSDPNVRIIWFAPPASGSARAGR